MPATKSVAAILYDRGDDVDALILDACTVLRRGGLRIGGIVQSSLGHRASCASSVHGIDLCTGERFNIWQQRGAGARGCRLDERGLIVAEPAILSAIAEGVDLVVINRFGRAESLGGGLIQCFTAAFEARIPLLTAVRPPYDAAWTTFHGGVGQNLAAQLESILSWVHAVTGIAGVRRRVLRDHLRVADRR
jgi:molybdate transport system ATP-binding protein